MSGLGTTVQPAGEPGSVTHPVPVQSETIPDAPKQIVQSTAIQTLDQLLHTNWIFDQTFTASTTMPAGTILYVKPIHPLEWNWPNKKVASMFNVWTGSGKIRYRPLATAWYGGSIRVGFLPPNLTRSQVQDMPLEVLTSYPNRDIDPKNTDWVDFRGPDQREVAYHYMKPFDDSDRQNFGGYLVFYIAGKLVTQAPEFTTIQFITELAGDFMYDQPSPRALEPAIDLLHPLGGIERIAISSQPLTDSGDCGAGQTVTVLPLTVKNLPAGGCSMSAVGVPNAINKNIEGIDKGTPSATYPTDVLCSDSYSQVNAGDKEVILTSGFAYRVNTNFNSDLTFANGGLASGVKYDYVIPDPPTFVPTAVDQFIPIKFVQPQTAPANDTMTYLTNGVRTATKTTYVNPVDPTQSAPVGFMKLSPLVSGESLVIFTNQRTRYYAPQTLVMADLMGQWSKDASKDDISWIYNLVNAAGTPLTTVRLNPNGMFTTNAASATVVYPGRLFLRFMQTLPLSSPLPPLTLGMRAIRSSITRQLRKPLPDLLSNLTEECEMA